MKIELSLQKTTIQPIDMITVLVTFQNTSKEVMEVSSLAYLTAFTEQYQAVDGSNVAQADQAPDNYTLEPNVEMTLKFHMRLPLQSYDMSADQVAMTLHFEATIQDVTIPTKPKFIAFKVDKDICIDCSQAEQLLGEDGEPTPYITNAGSVYFINKFSETSKQLKKIKLNATSAKALSPQYAKDNTLVYFGQTLQKDVAATAFQQLNSLFAGNNEIIYTKYGKAKVESPETFEVVGKVMPSQFSSQVDGYTCGFGRDKKHAYFFCDSTSQAHASQIKACKNPTNLVSLGFAYAKDEKHVYLESKRVPKADPDTFELLSRVYGKDKNRLYFNGRPIEGDFEPANIRILPSRPYPKCEDLLLDSEWFTDGHHIYHSWGIKTPNTEYENYCRDEDYSFPEDLMFPN